MIMKDIYQQLDELLKSKSFAELHRSEKALLEELGFNANEYEWLRRSKTALAEGTAGAAPRISEELEQALESKRPTKAGWKSLLNTSIPLWQAAAAFIILGLAGLWRLTTMQEANAPHLELPVLICQTDTVFQEVLQTDTIYLPGRPITKRRSPESILRKDTFATVAGTVFWLDQNEAHLPAVSRLEDLQNKKSGHPLKEHPDLAVFFTDALE